MCGNVCVRCGVYGVCCVCGMVCVWYAVCVVWCVCEQGRLAFLLSLYQRLLAGCVLLPHTHSMLGSFSWAELCDVIQEHVDTLTSDLSHAHDRVSACVCMV